jgi:hypothetical protein
METLFEADYAISLRLEEADNLDRLERFYFYWTGWHRRHWPVDVVRIGLKAPRRN